MKPQTHSMKTLGLIGCTNLHDSLMEYTKQQFGAEAELPYVYHHIDCRLLTTERTRLRETVLRSAVAFRYMDVAAIAFTTPELYEFAPRVAEKSGLPVLHLGDIIGTAIKNSGLRRVGFLSTKPTASKDPILSHINKAADTEIYLPEEWYVQRIGNVVKRIAQDPEYRYNGKDEDVLFSAISHLHITYEIQGVVLNCLEFRQILNDAAKFRFRTEHLNDPDFQFFDSTELLVKALVDFASA